MRVWLRLSHCLMASFSAALLVGVLDVMWALVLQPISSLWVVPSALTPWVICATLVGLILFLLDLFASRLCPAHANRPFEALVWLSTGSGGRPILTVVMWIVLLCVGNILGVLASMERIEHGILTVVLVIGGTLTIRWLFASHLAVFRSPAAYGVFTITALILVNTLGVFYIPHSIWVFVPILIVGASIGAGSVLPVRVSHALGLLTLILGFVGLWSRSETVHFWLNAYAPGQYGAWQVVQILSDSDGDGFSSILGGKDCDPWSSQIHPSQMEVVGNKIDETCGGWDLGAYAHYKEESQPAGRFSNDLKRPNVIVITVDALRADALKAQDGTVTPVLNQLASYGQTFERAYTPSPHTNESLPASMSGMYPSDWHHNKTFYGIQPTLAAQLRALGFDTSAVLCFPGMDQVVVSGFDYVDNSLGLEAGLGSYEITGHRTTELALARVDQVKDAPFFLWVHYFDPHMPLVPGSTPPGTGLLAAYAQEVYRTDAAIGTFLEGLVDRDLLKDTVLVVFSDHGEGLNEHRVLTHGWGIWESLVRIPLIFKLPGIPNVKSDTLVTVLDIVPTLFDYLGVVDGGYRRGMSLLPPMFGESMPERSVILESNYSSPSGLVRGVVRGDYKFIFDLKRSSYGLFNVVEDPAESRNLVDLEPVLAAQMRKELELWWKTTHNDVALMEKAKVWDDRRPRTPSHFVGDVGVTYEGGMGITRPEESVSTP